MRMHSASCALVAALAGCTAVSPAATAQVRVDSAPSGHEFVTWTAQDREGTPTVARLDGSPIDLPESDRDFGGVVGPTGDLLLHWSGGFDDGDQDVTYASLRPAGGGFGRTQVLSRKPRIERSAGAVGPGGDAAVVWGDTDGLRVSLLRRGETRWSDPIAVSPTGQVPFVGVDAEGNVTVAWRAVSATPTESEPVLSATLPAGATSFDAPVQVAPTGVLEQFHVAPDGAASALVVDYFKHSFVLAERPPGGEFAASYRITSEKVAFANLEANDRGDLLVTYGRSSVARLAVREPNGRFQPPITLFRGRGRIQTKLDERGNAVATSQSDDGVVWARHRPAGGPVGEKVAVARTPRSRQHVPGSAELAITGEGEGTVYWEESDGEHVEIKTRTVAEQLGSARVLTRMRTYPKSNATCVPRAAKVHARSTRAVVFLDKPYGYHACLRGRADPTSISDQLLEVLFPRIDVEGPLVAFGRSTCLEDTGGCQTELIVEDLRSDTHGLDRAGYLGERAGIGSIQVSSRAGFAWIQCGDYSPKRYETRSPDCTRPGGRVDIYKVEPYVDRTYRLARGTNIDPRSLQLSGHTLSWVQNGRRRTARLG